MTGYSVSPKTFTAGTKAKATPRQPTGTTFRFTLSEPATAAIDKLKKAAACRRTRSHGTLTSTSHAGANSVAFSGRLGSRALGAGSYRAALTATDAAANSATAQTVSFTVVRH